MSFYTLLSEVCWSVGYIILDAVTDSDQSSGILIMAAATLSMLLPANVERWSRHEVGLLAPWLHNPHVGGARISFATKGRSITSLVPGGDRLVHWHGADVDLFQLRDREMNG